MRYALAMTLLAVLAPGPLFGMGAGTDGIALPAAILEVSDAAWQTEFLEAAEAAAEDARVPMAVVAVVLASLPVDVANLDPDTAAALVRDESVLFDRASRAGRPVNQIAAASNRRIGTAVASAVRASRSNGGKPEDLPDAAANAAGEGATSRQAGPPEQAGMSNRASEALERRTAPVIPTGGPPFDIEERGRSDSRGQGVDDNPGAPDNRTPNDEDTPGGRPDDQGDPPVDQSSSDQ